MDKTIGYYIEKYIGLIIAIVIAVIFKLHWDEFSFIQSKEFLDKLITITTTLFSFLLTILTLIVQSNSHTVIEMQKHGSYNRLIIYNKNIVLISGLVCLLSLLISFLPDDFKVDYKIEVCYSGIINSALFIWALIDTLIFVLIFYKLLLMDNRK